MHIMTRTGATLASMLLATGLLAGCSQASSDEPAKPKASQSATTEHEVDSETVQIANGHFSVKLPKGWQMKEITNEYYQYNPEAAASIEFTNPDGQIMATLRTGADPWAEEAIPPPAKDNVLIDGGTLNEEKGAHLTFVADAASPDSAVIELTELSPDQQAGYPAVAVPFNYQGGSATFERKIGPKDELTDVDTGLKGAERMRAYAKTEEYAQLKSLMMSFEQLKDIQEQPPQEPTETPGT